MRIKNSFKSAADTKSLQTLALALILVSGCSSDGSDEPMTPIDGGDGPANEQPDGNDPILGSPDAEQSFAFVSTRARDYTSGQIVRISLGDGNTITGSYPATGSDIDVDTDGDNVYQIGRFNIDSVTRFDPLDTSTFDYQLSVNDDETSLANPQDLVFIDETKGYLTRRGSDKMWVIDPEPDNSPASVDDFLISEIDLSAYDIDLPNMTDALIVDDKLFVLMERLIELPSGNQAPDKPGYLAVFDTRTDTEITTEQSGNNLNGIRLLTRNPTHLQYNESTGQIYVIGRGNFFENTEISGDFHTGGVEVIDPVTYEHTLLLDDGTDADNNGYFLDGVIINETLGYLITADYNPAVFGPDNTQLRPFNPSTGELLAPVANLIDATESLALLEIGPDNHLWVGIDSIAPGFARIDLQNGEIAPERVATSLVPNGIAFLSIAQ